MIERFFSHDTKGPEQDSQTGVQEMQRRVEALSGGIPFSVEKELRWILLCLSLDEGVIDNTWETFDQLLGSLEESETAEAKRKHCAQALPFFRAGSEKFSFVKEREEEVREKTTASVKGTLWVNSTEPSLKRLYLQGANWCLKFVDRFGEKKFGVFESAWVARSFGTAEGVRRYIKEMDAILSESQAKAAEEEKREAKMRSELGGMGNGKKILDHLGYVSALRMLVGARSLFRSQMQQSLQSSLEGDATIRNAYYGGIEGFLERVLKNSDPYVYVSEQMDGIIRKGEDILFADQHEIASHLWRMAVFMETKGLGRQLTGKRGEFFVSLVRRNYKETIEKMTVVGIQFPQCWKDWYFASLGIDIIGLRESYRTEEEIRREAEMATVEGGPTERRRKDRSAIMQEEADLQPFANRWLRSGESVLGAGDQNKILVFFRRSDEGTYSFTVSTEAYIRAKSVVDIVRDKKLSLSDRGRCISEIQGARILVSERSLDSLIQESFRVFNEYEQGSGENKQAVRDFEAKIAETLGLKRGTGVFSRKNCKLAIDQLNLRPIEET